MMNDEFFLLTEKDKIIIIRKGGLNESCYL
jgi:hypothetical protein